MLAKLEAAPLLRRLNLVSDQVLSVRSALAPRADTASGAGGTRHGALGFAHLPHAMALHIFSFVPADERARAALVCRAWRVTVADPRLWTVLDLNDVMYSSGQWQPASDAKLRGAAALARGGLTVLRLDECNDLTDEARLEVVTANASSLRELSCDCVETISSAHVLELARAAPRLVSFNTDVSQASVEEATRMLRNEAFLACCSCEACALSDQTPTEVRHHLMRLWCSRSALLYLRTRRWTRWTSSTFR